MDIIKKNLPRKEVADILNISEIKLALLCKEYGLKKDKKQIHNNYVTTMNKKYNIDNSFQNIEVKNKIKETIKEKYNSSSYLTSIDYRLKKSGNQFLEDVFNTIKQETNKKYKIKIDKEYIIVNELNLIIHCVINDNNCIEISKEKEEAGIFVYHIFEYEWVNKRQKILNQLNNLLHLNEHTIGARKCSIKLLKSKEKNQFLRENHLQGEDKCNIAYGLFYNDELVSVMTFTKPRFNKKYEWELSRYACKANYNISGGASKLFKQFIKDYNPKNILSYSDISKTKGNLYQNLGFTLDHIADPNYIWYKNVNDYKTRYQCQKHKLLAKGFKGTTEVDIMKQLKYVKLYDCGNKVWVLNR